jgi:serine/threonine-protein kinase
VQRLGHRYELKDEIGSGGMGRVYLARDMRLLRDVAVKVLDVDPDNPEESFAYFHREARAAARLEHPNIVPVYDYSGPNETPPYIVMGLVRGDSLEDRLRALVACPEPVIFAIAHEVAAALAHAHEQGVVHRDLKPANVMLDNEGRVLLTDFGLAKAFRDPMRLGRSVAEMQTELMGTAEYLSPEQVVGEEVGAESDVFCLGSLVYRLCAGDSPFYVEDPLRCMQKTAAVEYVALPQARAGLSNALYRLVDGCLKRSPRERWSSAQVMAAAGNWLRGQSDGDPRYNVRQWIGRGEVKGVYLADTRQVERRTDAPDPTEAVAPTPKRPLLEWSSLATVVAAIALILALGQRLCG